MQRMTIPALSEMTAFWKEIPCNPSTRTWERGDSGTPRMKEKTFCWRIRSDFMRQDCWRLAGSSSRRKWGAGAQRRPPRCSSSSGGRSSRAGLAGAAGREEGDMDEGPQHRPQAKRSRRDRQRWALHSVRSCGADRRTAEQLETTPGNEGPEKAASEEERHQRREHPGRWRLSSWCSKLLTLHFHFLKTFLGLKSKVLISF